MSTLRRHTRARHGFVEVRSGVFDAVFSLYWPASISLHHSSQVIIGHSLRSKGLWWREAFNLSFFNDSHLNKQLIEKHVPHVETLAKCLPEKCRSPGVACINQSLFTCLFSLGSSSEMGSCHVSLACLCSSTRPPKC